MQSGRESGQCLLRCRRGSASWLHGGALRVGMLLVVEAQPVFAEIVAGDTEDGVDVVGVTP